MLPATAGNVAAAEKEAAADLMRRGIRVGGGTLNVDMRWDAETFNVEC